MLTHDLLNIKFIMILLTLLISFAILKASGILSKRYLAAKFSYLFLIGVFMTGGIYHALITCLSMITVSVAISQFTDYQQKETLKYKIKTLAGTPITLMLLFHLVILFGAFTASPDDTVKEVFYITLLIVLTQVGFVNYVFLGDVDKYKVMSFLTRKLYKEKG